MKSRIVIPYLWEDTEFYKCALETKVLFNYLINNTYLGLTRYSHINDRRIMFDTGLTNDQLEVGKRELGDLHWVLFFEDWQFHNHDCAYMDYFGNPTVMGSKEKELASIPKRIKEVFEGILTSCGGVKERAIHQYGAMGLERGCEPNINHKSETINHKSEIINPNTGDIEKINEIKRKTREMLAMKG